MKAEEVKRLAELKARLQRRLEALREEAETLESVISVIDSLLVAKSFRRVEALPPAPTMEAAPTVKVKLEQPPGKVFRLEASDGTLLAKMYATDRDVRIVVEPGLSLYMSTPPFQSFLVNRILKAMEIRDRELVSKGKISPEEAFSFNVKVEGDVIKEIHVRNYRDRRRLRELRTSTRWTLEKMYEKQRI